MKNLFKGFIMAVSMFTIIPLPYYEWDDEGGKNIMKCYPIIGAIVGVIWYLLYKVLLYFNLPTIIITAFITIIPFIITGMLHLDGYMDVCDALLSRRDQEEKLRILKDPNAGAFAVISVIIIFIINFSTTYTIVCRNKYSVLLILIPIMSRALMGYLLLCKKSLKSSSLGSYFKNGTGVLDKSILIIFFIVTSVISVMIVGIKGVFLPIVMVSGGILVVNNSCKALGGINGDIAGYGLVIAETVGLLVISII